MDIKGKVAIVTGGGSGLGEATARMLAAKGATVAIFDRDEARAKLVAGEIGGRAYKLDITDGPGAEAAFASVQKDLGDLRIVVHCAGIGVAKRTVGRDGAQPLEDFAQVVSINLIGTFNMIRLAGATMSKLSADSDNQRGVIVTTASVAAFDGQIGQAAYSASKAGVHGMTLPIAREFAQFGIRIATIAPGIFLTPMLAGLPQEAQDSLAVAVPNPHRLGNPAEYAALATHIVENNYINGETIRLDASLRMAPR